MNSLKSVLCLAVIVPCFGWAQQPQAPTVLGSTCVSGCASQQTPEQQQLTRPLVSFTPGQQPPVSYRDKTVEITLVVGGKKKGGDWHELSLKVVDRSLDQTKVFALPGEIAQVSDVRRVVNNQIAVTGMISSNGFEVAILDLSSGEIKDTFWCEFPSISPDGKYIAFIEWISRSSPSADNHYMLYNLLKDAQHNRSRNAVVGDTAGEPFYPAGASEAASPGTEHIARSEFFWSPDSRQIVFADQVDSNPYVSIVLGIVTETGTVDVRTIEQSIEDLCAPGSGEQPTCSVLMRKVTFTAEPAPAIDAVFELVRTRQLKSKSYPVSQFK